MAPRCFAATETSATASPDRNAIALEALNRLKGMDLESNPALKGAVLRVLESVKGSPQFVEIVRDFKISGQERSLLEFAVRRPSDSMGAEAGRMLLSTDKGLALLSENLNSSPAMIAMKTAEFLGNTGDKRAISLLETLVTNDSLEMDVRKQAVNALAQFQDGAAVLIGLAKEGKLQGVLKLAASAKLNSAPWPAIKQGASEVLPLPHVQDSEPLPAISELVKRAGDAKRGAEVFASAAVACITCHRVRDQGIDFGPNLSEIGTKLGKDALYESILDPSAGVSFGFEAWELVLRNGDEMTGLLASETAEEISLKTQNGIVTAIKKSDIADRKKLSASIMPSGLQQAMTTQELVDLVEFLASLKASK